MNSKNFIVIFDFHRDRRSKNFKLIFFFKIFSCLLCFFILIFLFISGSVVFFLFDLKLIEKLNQSFFSENFFFSSLIFFNLSFFSFFSFLIDQTMLLAHYFKKTLKIDFKFRAFKSIFKILIEIITMLYSKSIDSVSELVLSSRKIRKKNQSNWKRHFVFKIMSYWWIFNNQSDQLFIQKYLRFSELVFV